MRKYIEVNDIAAYDSADTDARVADAERILVENPEILDWPGRAEACEVVADFFANTTPADISDEFPDDEDLAAALVEGLVNSEYTYMDDWPGPDPDQHANTSFDVSIISAPSIQAAIGGGVCG